MTINFEQPINVILTQIDERLTAVEAAVGEGSGPEPVVAPLVGVNLVGGEYDTPNFYPSSEHVQYWTQKGVTILRIPMRLNRVVPDPATGADATEIGNIDRIISVARQYQNPAYPVTILLDDHRYGNGDDLTDGQRWGVLAQRYGTDAYVGYELSNEPTSNDYSYTTPRWISFAQTIFAKSALGPVVFPLAGSNLNYAFVEQETWKILTDTIKTSFGDRLSQCKITFHQYTPVVDDSTPDTDETHYSPTSALREAASVMAVLDREGIDWLWGEIAVPAGTAVEYSQPGFDETTGDTVSMWNMDNLLSAMTAQRLKHAWGITFWSGGHVGSYHPVRNPGAERWGLQPINGVDQPQVRIMQRYLPGGEKYGQVTQAIVSDTVIYNPGEFVGNNPVWGGGVRGVYMEAHAFQKSRSTEYTYAFAMSGLADGLARVLDGTRSGAFGSGAGFIASYDPSVNSIVFGYWTDNFQMTYLQAIPHDQLTNDLTILTLVVDGTGGRVFSNGILVSTGPRGVPQGLHPHLINVGGSNGFAGTIHEAQVYHRSLSDTEVAAIAPATGRETALVGYLPFQGDHAMRAGLRGGLPSRYMQVLGLTG